MTRPIPNGVNGRDSQGRFATGNAGGPGNPYARQVAALRRALHAAVSEEEVKEVGRALLKKAKVGDVPACKLLLSYLVGKPVATNLDFVAHAESGVSKAEAIRAVREIYGLDVEEHP